MVLLLGLEHLGRSPALVVEASAATDEGDERGRQADGLEPLHIGSPRARVQDLSS